MEGDLREAGEEGGQAWRPSFLWAARDATDGGHPQQLPQVGDKGAEREVEGAEILFHGFGQTDGRIPARRQEMGERGIGEDTQGDEVLQAFEGPDTRLFQAEDLLEVLVEDFDAPAAEVGVGDGHGGAPTFLGGRERAEADTVEVEGAPVEGAGNDQDGMVAPAMAREHPFAPADVGALAARRGLEGHGTARSGVHVARDGSAGPEDIAAESP